MFFRNARVFRFTKPFQVTAEGLEQHLEQDAFKPCGPQETSRQGWVSPLGKQGETLVHSAGGYHLVCLCRQEKILPPAVIKELLEEKVEVIEQEQHRKVRRKERDELKDQLMLELLPQAFSKHRRTYAYLDPKGGFMVVDAGSARQAEDLASHLRKSLGSLPVRPPAVKQSPAFTFTGWLNETIDIPGQLTLGSIGDLVDPAEDGGTIKARGLDLQGDEIRGHLEAGMQATRLALTWEDSVSFTLDEEFGIRGLKFGDTIREKLDDIDADDALARFDAAFSLMTLELSRMIPGLLAALGGEDRSAIAEDSGMVVGVDLAKPGEDTTALLTLPSEPPGSYSSDPCIPPPKAVLEHEIDALYLEAVQFVTETQRVTVSSIQRKFKIGYNRAFNLVDAMEANGVVSKAGHNGTREVLAPPPETAEA